MEVLCGGECFYRGRHPMSKGALDIGGRKVIKQYKNQTIALAVGTKAVTQSGIVSRDPALKTAGCSSTYKMCISAVHQYIWLSIIRSLK
jgi:hypothetical protein